jgi:hypothetical protein
MDSSNTVWQMRPQRFYLRDVIAARHDTCPSPAKVSRHAPSTRANPPPMPLPSPNPARATADNINPPARPSP